MVQLTIDFLINPNQQLQNNHFFLEWTSRHTPSIPIFLPKQKTTFSHGFLNKLIHMPTIVCGNISKRNDKILHPLNYDGEMPEYSNIHFLKSHLQKCIRQKQHSLAIQTAKHLIELDPTQFLRRLAIIFVEDVMITKHYSTIIWLMIAVSSNKFKLQLHHKEWLLGLIHIACDCPWRDTYLKPKISTEKLPQTIMSELKKIQNPENYATILSILIRAGYGGMHGDTKMLLKAAFTWTKRFQKNEENYQDYYNQNNRTISYSVLPLQKEQWLLEAIDFHCFPKMLQWISEKENIPEDYLKHLIWNFHSKTNKRPFYKKNTENHVLTEEDKETWKKIKNQVFSIAKYAIKNYS